jgi:hypothetical protein
VGVDRCDNQLSGIFRWHLFDVDDDPKLAVLSEHQSPTFQELLRISIEVTVREWCRIHRVDQFRQFDDAQLDLVDGWMTLLHIGSARGIKPSLGGICSGVLDDRDRHLGRMQHPLRYRAEQHTAQSAQASGAH